MASFGLSKSRIIAWKQCPKRLWLQINRPDLLIFSDGAQQNFQIGYEVGKAARTLFDNGIFVREDIDLSAALEVTQTMLNVFTFSPRHTIFEGAFQYDGVLIRADLLIPTTKNYYRFVEVKASTQVKQYHIDDCAVQAWVLRQNELPLTSIELAHIDTSFVYQGDGDYHGLFHYENLDAVVKPLLKQVPEWVAEARRTLAGDEPAIATGAQCDDPFECPFKAYCNRDLVVPEPPEYSLDVLYRMSASSKAELRNLGIEDACQVPADSLTEVQQWIQRISQSGVAELKPSAADMLQDLPYPRYYLDFETINLAVPRWANTRPYSTQVPFQWSCHIELSEGLLEHEMFLDVTGDDPRRACAKQMIAALGKSGPVFVYYQSFEKGRIAELAELFPDLAKKLLAINDRIVDLLPIARANYYHPAMHGSWSIKAVLPTIAPDLDYTQLTVGNGGDAQQAYQEILHPDTPDARKLELTEGLRTYCTLDTLAMVRLAWYFQGLQIHYFMPERVTGERIGMAMVEQIEPLFSNAMDILRQHCQATATGIVVQPVSLLQRKLRLGYKRAVKLVAEFERRGILSPPIGVISNNKSAA